MPNNNLLPGLWNQYNQERLAGNKKAATQQLLAFIELLKQQDQNFISKFADDLCEKTLHNDDILANNGLEVSNNTDRIQHPIFKEIILPVLKQGYLANSALHMKWIGQLEQFFYSDNKTTDIFLQQINANAPFSSIYFFKKSYRIENHPHTLSLILKRTAQDIEYYLHELPFVVLAQPAIFESELKDFKDYWELANAKDQWKIRLPEWENIAKHWDNYFNNRDRYADFMDYQQQLNIELR